MVQSISNFTQQAVISPFQKKGDQQQTQIEQKRQQDQSTTSTQQYKKASQTRLSGTEAAQSQGSNSQSYRNPTELSISEFRAQFGIDENETPQRGSIVDISA